MLARAAPNARLLVSLRDPVERYLSGLQRHHRMAAARGESLDAMAPIEAFAQGLYRIQLTRLLKHFERSQILILQYERCVLEPRAQLRRTYEFLGVRKGFLPDLDGHPNRQAAKPTFGDDARRALIEAYADEVALLARDYPEIDVGLWSNFG
jgi:hypothetical protein